MSEFSDRLARRTGKRYPLNYDVELKKQSLTQFDGVLNTARESSKKYDLNNNEIYEPTKREIKSHNLIMNSIKLVQQHQQRFNEAHSKIEEYKRNELV